MWGTTKNSKPRNVPNCRDHMANERTFLAWVRTSIGIMALSFVVEKLALFMNRLSHVIEKNLLRLALTSSNNHQFLP